MAKTKCPRCGYTESDDRPHDRTTYSEVCIACTPKTPKALLDFTTSKAIADAKVLWDLPTKTVRDLIATEREQLRALGPLANACRDELARRCENE